MVEGEGEKREATAAADEQRAEIGAELMERQISEGKQRCRCSCSDNGLKSGERRRSASEANERARQQREADEQTTGRRGSVDEMGGERHEDAPTNITRVDRIHSTSTAADELDALSAVHAARSTSKAQRDAAAASLRRSLCLTLIRRCSPLDNSACSIPVARSIALLLRVCSSLWHMLRRSCCARTRRCALRLAEDTAAIEAVASCAILRVHWQNRWARLGSVEEAASVARRGAVRSRPS